MQKAFALEIVQKLVDEGYEALWAGGCVRDKLMGNTPHDYDVATSATPDQVRELFGRKRTLAIGASFGVIVVLPEKRSVGQVEVATFRCDANYSDGRRPDSVTFSTAEQDAQRRDFTINGMFYDPIKQEVVDYVGGQEDLKLGIVRAIGDPVQRIAEDKLRMLRAIRFCARFGFQLDPNTSASVTENSKSINVVSGERIAQELRKTLATQRPGWALDELHRSGLLNGILPMFADVWDASGPVVKRMLAGCQSAAWLDRFTAVCWAVVGAELEKQAELLSCLREQLKFANEELDAIRFALLSQPMLDEATQRPWSATQPIVIHPHIRRAESLLQCRASIGETTKRNVQWLNEKGRLPIDQLDPDPILTGADLIEAELSPGPRFKELLSEVRALQLDGQLADRESALEWLAKNAV
ncbi:MAG: CCA tRNA nucleotidyltransferase [Aureliella sp.]